MRKFGLIGYPLTHSFSKKYFTDKFEREGYRECTYENFPVPDEAALAAFATNPPDLEGFNITIPWKEKLLPYLHWKSAAVQQIGAANCVRIVDRKTYGFNTDVKGFSDSLTPLLRDTHNKALVLGTGGAAKAVAYGLQLLGIEFMYVSRQSKKGLTIGYQELTPDMLRQYKLVINTTPLGMYPDTGSAPELPYDAIGSSHYLFDLTYNPALTTFLKRGQERGAVIKNGADMLTIQAEESWKIWNQDLRTLTG